MTLFAAGSVKGRLVGRSRWRSGVEMTVVAGLCAAAGFVIGRLAGRPRRSEEVVLIRCEPVLVASPLAW